MSEIGFAYSIDDFDFQLYCLSIGPSDHDIARLQVAVDQTLGRRRNQRPRHLNRDFESQFRLEWTLSPNEGFQGFALNQFHRVIAAIDFRRSAELKYASDIRMLQCRRRSCLAQEPSSRRAISKSPKTNGAEGASASSSASSSSRRMRQVRQSPFEFSGRPQV